jgi:hypothetical protein
MKRTPFLGFVLGAAVLAVLLCGSMAQAQSIGVQFVGGGGPGDPNTPMDPSETAGAVVIQGNWNPVTGPEGGFDGTNPPVALNDAAGNPTGAMVAFWSSSNTWTLPLSGAVAGDTHLMKGYLDTTATSTTIVMITGIPYTTYDVYVYTSGDNGNNDRKGLYGLNDLTFQNPQSSMDPAGEIFGITKTTYDLGQEYVVFAAASGGTVMITATPDPSFGTGGFRAPTNAIQIVSLD